MGGVAAFFALWLLPLASMAESPLEPLPTSGTVKLRMGEPLMLRVDEPLKRTSVADGSVAEVIAYSQREIALHGKSAGTTNVIFWFADAKREPVTYVVEVAPRK